MGTKLVSLISQPIRLAAWTLAALTPTPAGATSSSTIATPMTLDINHPWFGGK